ncbi:hypothetical protein F1559_003213 [Cyanidiococcus yangmingshanensis]|uniref:Uncharacterized protein n=1 Tax=Cyanidiococcus yangmingshanensis TaxID=2690220 RepID=A0A7J7IKZ4_9RHOD|nr:hypothetical protein F1559_003213 [Cyanidiococcus yangmingshanensis]
MFVLPPYGLESQHKARLAQRRLRCKYFVHEWRYAGLTGVAAVSPAPKAARLTGLALLVVGSVLVAGPQLGLRWWFPSPYFSAVSVRLIGLVAQGYGVYYWSAAVSPRAFFWSTVFFRLYLAATLVCWAVALRAPFISLDAIPQLRLCLGSIALVNGAGALLMLRALTGSQHTPSE